MEEQALEVNKIYNDNLIQVIEIENEYQMGLGAISEKYDQELWTLESDVDKSIIHIKFR